MDTLSELKKQLENAAAEKTLSVCVDNQPTLMLSVSDMAGALGVAAKSIRKVVANLQVNTATGLNLRSAPTVLGTILQRLPNGTRVSLLDVAPVQAETYTWLNVITAEGSIGWLVQRYVDRVTGAPASTGNKIGVQFMGALSSDDIRYAVAMNASVYKAVDNSGALIAAHAAHPDALYIYRRYAGSEDDPAAYVAQHGGAEAAAQAWIESMRGELDQMPFAYFESFNEKAPSRDYIDFEIARMNELHNLNRKACVLNAGTAAIDDGWWAGDDGVRLGLAAVQHDALIGVHGYAQSVLSANYGGSYFGSNGEWVGELFPAFAADIHHDDWTALRVIRYIDALKTKGIKPKFVLTEFGLDDVATDKAPSEGGNGIYYFRHQKTRGWKSCKDVWSECGWLNGTSPEAFYIKQLKWANDILSHVDQIVGATIYTLGTDDPKWADFDVRDVIRGWL